MEGTGRRRSSRARARLATPKTGRQDFRERLRASNTAAKEAKKKIRRARSAKRANLRKA